MSGQMHDEETGAVHAVHELNELSLTLSPGLRH